MQLSPLPDPRSPGQTQAALHSLVPSLQEGGLGSDTAPCGAPGPRLLSAPAPHPPHPEYPRHHSTASLHTPQDGELSPRPSLGRHFHFQLDCLGNVLLGPSCSPPHARRLGLLQVCSRVLFLKPQIPGWRLPPPHTHTNSSCKGRWAQRLAWCLADQTSTPGQDQPAPRAQAPPHPAAPPLAFPTGQDTVPGPSSSFISFPRSR